IDLGKIDLAPVTEDFFARPKASKSKSEEAFFKKGDKAEKVELPQAKKDAQAKIDEQIMTAIKGNEDMAKYLGSIFSLHDRDLPHAMKF
ncbi:60S ribosomal protein L6, partial [Diplonema papillatum]